MILTEKAIKWFKLSRDPFTGEMESIKDVFLPRSISIAEMRLWKAIDECQIACLIGEVGSGKTTIMARVLAQVDRNKLYRVVRIYTVNCRKITPSQIFDAMIEDLIGISCYNSTQIKARLIGETLEEAKKVDHKVILLIDDAHELPTWVLKDLKKLQEIKKGLKTSLSVILLGQPALLRRLRKEVALKEILERAEIIEIKGFRDQRESSEDPMKEARQYITWKLQKAGGRKLEEVFTPEGLAMLLDHPAARYPLGLSNLVSAAMFVATESEEHKINDDVVANAFTQVEYELEEVAEEEDQEEDQKARKVS